MNLTTDAMAQTEQPSTPPAAATPAAPAETGQPQTGQTQTGQTQTGQAANDHREPPPNLPDMFAQLVPIFVIMGIVYLVVIRPRARKEKELLAQLRNVRRGDTLVMSSGIVGKVTKSIDDNEIEVEIAPNVRVRMLRSAISEVRARGEPVKDQPAKG